MTEETQDTSNTPAAYGLVANIGRMTFARPRSRKTYDNGDTILAEVTITFPALGLVIEQQVTGKIETRGGKTVALPHFSIPRKLSVPDEDNREMFVDHVLNGFDEWAKDLAAGKSQDRASTASRLVRSVDWEI